MFQDKHITYKLYRVQKSSMGLEDLPTYIDQLIACLAFAVIKGNLRPLARCTAEPCKKLKTKHISHVFRRGFTHRAQMGQSRAHSSHVSYPSKPDAFGMEPGRPKRPMQKVLFGALRRCLRVPRDPVVPNLRFGTTGPSWHLHNSASNHLRRYLDP